MIKHIQAVPIDGDDMGDECHYCITLACQDVQVVSRSGLLGQDVVTPFKLCNPHFIVIKMFVDLLKIYG